MASPTQVRAYLASWFQLNRSVVISSTAERLCPHQVIAHGDYSLAFEDCWRTLENLEWKDCYLEGTQQTLAELLSDQWDVVACARCTLPIPMPLSLTKSLECPCGDLPSWPNNQIPLPHLPVDNQRALGSICNRVTMSSEKYMGSLEKTNSD